jgi:hypothetical protein
MSDYPPRVYPYNWLCQSLEVHILQGPASARLPFCLATRGAGCARDRKTPGSGSERRLLLFCRASSTPPAGSTR